jgi:hypothetical protein
MVKYLECPCAEVVLAHIEGCPYAKGKNMISLAYTPCGSEVLCKIMSHRSLYCMHGEDPEEKRAVVVAGKLHFLVTNLTDDSSIASMRHMGYGIHLQGVAVTIRDQVKSVVDFKSESHSLTSTCASLRHIQSCPT